MSTIPASQHFHNVPVHDLAAAWDQFAGCQGHADPDTELMAVPTIDKHNNPGWRPAFRVPSTKTLVVVFTARPHASFMEAKRCLCELLTTMATEGSIVLQQEIAA